MLSIHRATIGKRLTLHEIVKPETVVGWHRAGFGLLRALDNSDVRRRAEDHAGAGESCCLGMERIRRFLRATRYVQREGPSRHTKNIPVPLTHNFGKVKQLDFAIDVIETGREAQSIMASRAE